MSFDCLSAYRSLVVGVAGFVLGGFLAALANQLGSTPDPGEGVYRAKAVWGWLLFCLVVSAVSGFLGGAGH